MKDVPSGRLGLHLYAAYHGSSWEKYWREGEDGSLRACFDAVVLEARAAAERILLDLNEHQRRQEESRKQQEAEEARYRQEEQKRKKAEAAKESHKQILNLMNEHVVAQQIRNFLDSLTTYSTQLPEQERVPFEARLNQARAFLGDLRPEEIFARWEAPAAILRRMSRY